MVCPELPHYSSGFLVLQVLGHGSVWGGSIWILVWGQQECPAAGQSFFSKNMTDPDQSDDDDARRGCDNLQVPFFPLKKKNQPLFIEYLLWVRQF